MYEYQKPEQLDDGWDTASLSDVGMDETIIVQSMNDILYKTDHQIHSILLVKEDKLVFEEYFPGYAFYHGPLTGFDRETKHNLASVTKSFTSALIGLAIDQGFLQDVNQKVFDFLPEYANLRTGEKDKITLEHLLTMTSGLEWDESTYLYTDPRNDCAQLFHQSDPIRYVLGKPVATEPGVQFLYNSGNTNVLGEIIRKATGLRADEFADEHLFAPLGITDFWWKELPNEVCYTSGDMKLRPRDMAKFGLVYLNEGSWKGEQILSGEWVEASTTPSITVDPYSDYGYQWWIHNHEVNTEQIPSFSARGWGGQNIIVFPDLDMVVVTTAGYYDEPELESKITLLTLYILASVL